MTETSDVDLLLNMDVARKLGLTFPDDVIKSAKTVIENGKMKRRL